MSREPGMEKNYWAALALSMIVLLTYPLLLRKMHPAPAKTENPAVAIEEKKAGLPEVAAQTLNAIEKKFTAPETVEFSNAFYDIKFSSLGGTIVGLTYKGDKKKDHEKVPFYIEGPEGGVFGTKISNQELDLSKTNFHFERKTDNVFTFVYEKTGDFRFTKQFTVDSQRPTIQLAIALENLTASERQFPLEIDYALHYSDSLAPHHVDIESVIFQEKVKGTKLGPIKKKGFMASGDIEWAGLLKKYFALLVKPDWKITSEENRADEEVISGALHMEPVTVPPSSKVEKQVFIYAGPQRYETLKNLKMDFELILSKGFFGLFKIWLLISLKFLNQFTHNYGFAIILLTIILKVLFAPMTHMSYESMRKMQAIQPKMKSIQERYKSDPTKMNREVMELYRRNKVNPMGGCLPMLAQIPIFIAFYQVLNETIELKGAPFAFWIHDLAQPDKLFMLPFNVPVVGNAFHLLPIFMAASMYWQQKVTPQASTSSDQAAAMKFMPLIMGVILYNMPSGLALYWFVNNMLTVGHQLIIKRMGDVILHHEDRD